MESSYLPFLKGFFTGAGLIIGIGAQNAFVLKQGLKKNHVFVTALFCTLADMLLIGLGVGGLADIFTLNWILLFIAKWGGAAFLFWWGFRAFRSMFKSESLQAQNAHEPSSHSLDFFRNSICTLKPSFFLWFLSRLLTDPLSGRFVGAI